MSLLLDALKKAEKAKDEAKRRAQAGTDPDETVMQVRTRNELPDISNPLEIHSEDIPGGAPQPEALSLVQDAYPPAQDPLSIADSPAPPTAAPRTAPADTARRGETRRDGGPASDPDPHAGQRAAAKNVFETKFREPNPRLPFQITMAFLGVFALGTVVYFWYQLRPPPSLVNTNPRPPADEKLVVSGPPPAGAAPARPVAVQESGTIPGMPAKTAASGASAIPLTAPAAAAAPAAPVVPAAPVPAAQSPLAPAAAPTSKASPATRRASAAPADAGPARTPPKARAPANGSGPSAEPSKLSVRRETPAVNPKVQAGWIAYNKGDLATARANYQEVVRTEPTNRDALLGMAALEVRANRPAEAESYYQKLLEFNPRDPHAQAGLMALRAHMTDPVQAESRVKNLLAGDPEAHVLYFTLGNEYAQQRRWPEAQQAYFKAYSADPENPDFAYNLAVSLDHVRQPRLALEYYRRAIALAQQRSSNFDQTLARNRAQELAK